VLDIGVLRKMVFGVKDIILMKDQIKTRFATEDDASDLCAILNQIIKIGGTTAFEKELNETSFFDQTCLLDGLILQLLHEPALKLKA